MKIVEIRADAIIATRELDARNLLDARTRLRAVVEVISNTTLSDAEVGQTLRCMDPLEPVLFKSRAAVVRWIQSNDTRAALRLLKQLLTLDLQGEKDSSLLAAVASLRDWYDTGRTSLPAEVTIDFARPWKDLLSGSDRQRAFRAYEAATLGELRKAIRNGSVWVTSSLSYRHRERILLSAAQWKAQKSRYFQQFGLPTRSKKYVERLVANAKVGLDAVTEAVRCGDVTIDEDGLHIEALEAEKETSLVASTRRALFADMGQVQLPELMMFIDSHTRFSWSLLGREPASARELLSIYAALLAQGTELDAASVALMIPPMSEDTIASTMRVLEDGAGLRKGNEQVVEFLRRHPIVKHWGKGTIASSDSMSLDVSRHLWNARIDPRRRTYGMGMYTHLLDQWGIIYDQAIMLGKRQAGVAIEGMIRQTASTDVERLAVDTHGYTDIGMALAKVLGFDLCPRLKGLRDRCLHVPRGTKIPIELKSAVKCDVSLSHIDRGWDQFIRLAASVESGWTSAVLALERFGTAARADPIHKSGTEIGKLLRTIFLCDYITNPTFRREVLRILNHGESVHALQRVIHFGSVSAVRGRRREELIAISGSLALLTNITMAWMTHHMQRVLDEWKREGRSHVGSDVLRHIAPVHYRGINFRGELHFPVDAYRRRLVRRAA